MLIVRSRIAALVLLAVLIGPGSGYGGLAAASPMAGSSRAALQQVEQAKVDINSASSEELQTVPGLGPALAQRIIDFREEHGPFERVEDLLNVRGIGVKTLERLRPHVKVEKPKNPKDPKTVSE